MINFDQKIIRPAPVNQNIKPIDMGRLINAINSLLGPKDSQRFKFDPRSFMKKTVPDQQLPIA